ncbi:MAG: nucleoside triphosphate pyrophosphohydrolase family protein [Saprospiraceae bacterium]|nr:nucleoside triphosphate pyrophosphohydrolase family protein [Saprospiraceae bacterium]
MEEPRPLNDVADFHNTFDLPILNEPTIPDESRCRLRINLIEEELKELKEAIEDNDLTEVADAFADLQYVLSGAILEFGLGQKFKAIFEEVQRSNMSKTCKSLEEAEATQAHYMSKDGTVSEIVKRGHEYIVYRKNDGKVLKSVNYSEANIKSFL